MRTLLMKNNFNPIIVDDNVYNIAKQYNWYAKPSRNKFYPTTSVTLNKNHYAKVALHHIVIGYPLRKLEVDHINGNTFDNRLSNLRIVSHQENLQNQTKFNWGVTKTPNGKWRSRIQFNKRRVSLGTFNTFEEAKMAYKVFLFI